MLSLLPLTLLALGTSLIGQAIDAAQMPTFPELTLYCSTMSYTEEGDGQETQIDITFGDIFNYIDPEIGASCDASSGMNFDPTLGLDPQSNWQLLRA
jgi:hypothetical protein